MTGPFFPAVVGFVAIALGSAPSSAQMAYITNGGGNTVSMIDTATNTVRGTILVGASPLGVAATPDGSMAYITNTGDNTVSVIDTAANTVVATITVVGFGAGVVAVSPDGSKVYVTSYEQHRLRNARNGLLAGLDIGDRHRDQHGCSRASGRRRPDCVWCVQSNQGLLGRLGMPAVMDRVFRRWPRRFAAFMRRR